MGAEFATNLGHQRTAVGAVVRLPATAIEEGRGLSSMSGVAYRLLPA